MPSWEALPSPRTSVRRVVRECSVAIRASSGSPVCWAAWKMIPTFIMMSMNRLSGARKLRR
jgi:hypothetical protein